VGGWGSCEGITQIGLEVGEGWAVRWSSSRVGHAPNRILSSSDPRATPHRSRTDQHLQPPKAVIDQPMTPHRPPSNLDSALHRGRVKLVPPTSVRHRFSRLHDHVPLPSGGTRLSSRRVPHRYAIRGRRARLEGSRGRAPFSASTRDFSFNSNGGDEEEGHTIDISDTIGDLALGPQFAPEMTRVPPIGCACPCSLSEIGATRPGATFRVH